MPKQPNTDGDVQRHAEIQSVALAVMRVSPLVQRELKPYHVNHLIAQFDIEQVGVPTLNYRDGHHYVIDGQHRIEAMRGMGLGETKLDCAVFSGLTDQQEAEMFLRLNNVLAVNGFDRYRVGVQAGREEDCALSDILDELGLHVSMDRTEGSVHCIGTLRRIYQQTGGDNLSRTLRIVHTAYGDFGLASAVIDGIGILLHRYEGQLHDTDVIARFATIPGGLNALLALAEKTKQKTHCSRRFAVAAAGVEILNGAKGIRLGNWFRENSRRKAAA